MCLYSCGELWKELPLLKSHPCTAMNEIVESWRIETERKQVREFPLHERRLPDIERRMVGECETNVIRMKPDKDDRLLAVQDISLDRTTMKELCIRAGNLGITLWRGNDNHQEILRYNWYDLFPQIKLFRNKNND